MNVHIIIQFSSIIFHMIFWDLLFLFPSVLNFSLTFNFHIQPEKKLHKNNVYITHIFANNKAVCLP